MTLYVRRSVGLLVGPLVRHIFGLQCTMYNVLILDIVYIKIIQNFL